MTPPCHNRPPYTDPNAGWVRVKGAFSDGKFIPSRPVYRYRWPWFTDRCATWSGTGIGPNGERYPEARGWDCRGCRWLPEGVL